MNVVVQTLVAIIVFKFCGSEDIEYTGSVENVLTPQEKPLDTISNNFQVPDEKWVSLAIKNIAYYVRHYKFNEWDRREFDEKPNSSAIGFFKKFPSPPLRTLHWEVNDYCRKSFLECIAYLQVYIDEVPFARRQDMTMIFMDKSLPLKNDLIRKLDNDCKRALINSMNVIHPFFDTLDRFKWLTTAAYYMCWYTMVGVPFLSMIGESCDNFANCLEPDYGYHNRDLRSDDRQPFACALHSFCPDPCCPKKHIRALHQCDNEDNPCYFEGGTPTNRRCAFDRKSNQNLKGIIKNEWNITCKCKDLGFMWISEMGMCVDINECATGSHTCDNTTEECINLPGTYECICKFGFSKDIYNKTCSKIYIFKSSHELTDESRTFFENFISYFSFSG